MRTVLSNQKPIYKQIRDGFGWFYFFFLSLFLVPFVKERQAVPIDCFGGSYSTFYLSEKNSSHTPSLFVSFHNSNILMSFSKVLPSWHVASDFVWASSPYLYLFLSFFFHTNSFDINNKRETAECCCQGESFIQDHRDSFTCHYGHIVRKAIGRGEHLEI